MKFEIALFLVILILTAIGIQAQPGCREKFSPYSICNTDYATADFIFVGEVVTLGKIDPDFFMTIRDLLQKLLLKLKNFSRAIQIRV